MPPRAPRGITALILLGVLIVFVSVIAQLATSNGLEQVIWVAITVVGLVLAITGIVLLVRRAGRRADGADDDG